MEVIVVLVAALAACVLLVAVAWHRGGARIGLWTLGSLLVGLGLALAGVVLAFVDARCETGDCADHGAEVAIALSGAALSFLCAVALTARAGRPTDGGEDRARAPAS